MLVAEAFLRSLIKLYYMADMLYIQMVAHGIQWYPEACHALGLEHRLHSPYEKSIIERMMEYVKDRTECFDDYYPCVKQECNLSHVHKWIDLFVFMHNTHNAARTDGYKLDDGG